MFVPTDPAATPAPLALAIAGMSCGHCVAAVRSALATVPGVAAAQVDVGSATITPAPGADAGAVRTAAIVAVGAAGYDARPAGAPHTHALGRRAPRA